MNLVDSDGRTALHLATANGQQGVVQFLTSAGADCSIPVSLQSVDAYSQLIASVAAHQPGHPTCSSTRADSSCSSQ